MFKKLFALLLAIQIVISVPGVTLFAHYCNGTLADLSLLSREDPCKSKGDSSCCKMDSNKVAEEKPSCCSKSSDSDPCSLTEEACCNTLVVSSDSYPIAAFRPSLSMQGNAELDRTLVFVHLPFHANFAYLYASKHAPPCVAPPFVKPVLGSERCAQLSCFLI